MPVVQNTAQLLSHGNTVARQAALTIIEQGLAGADPYQAFHRTVGLEAGQLHVGQRRYDLDADRRVFVLGAGKATFPIAKALEELLADRITDGLIICKHGQQGELRHVNMVHAGHPIPDEHGLEGARRTLALAEQTQPGDIVLCCYTGGSSALLPYPVDPVTLGEKKEVNRVLLSCGADIFEINAVRKHLSRIKGGRLVAAIHPEAELINLTVSDVIGDHLDYITDPTVPDTSSLDDARATLTRYDLWNRLPSTVTQYLKTAGPDRETPKESDFKDRSLHSTILVAGDAACSSAAQAAEALGLETMILSTMLDGDSAELGRTFAAIGREIVQNHRPLAPPCAVIAGGETLVTIDDEFGLGGPNQEFALAAAVAIDGCDELLIAAIDSDGTDGPTDLAGALADGTTAGRARDAGIDLEACLKRHDVTRTLTSLGDAIETGATGTNVNDLKLLLVMSPEGSTGPR